MNISREPSQCDTIDLLFEGGVPPYKVVIEARRNDELVAQTFSGLTNHSLRWQADVCGGNVYTYLYDGAGSSKTRVFEVYLSDDTSCLTESQRQSNACVDPPPYVRFDPNSALKGVNTPQVAAMLAIISMSILMVASRTIPIQL